MSSPDILSLKWNNHRSTFISLLSCVYNKFQYDDATVACDGKLYPVHRLVLSACSNYFEQMFALTHGKHSVIVLKDITTEVFEALLSYMYLGEVEVRRAQLTNLISAAHSLEIKGLVASDTDKSSVNNDVPDESVGKTGNKVESHKRTRDNDTANISTKVQKLDHFQGADSNSYNGTKNYPNSTPECNSNEVQSFDFQSNMSVVYPSTPLLHFLNGSTSVDSAVDIDVSSHCSDLNQDGIINERLKREGNNKHHSSDLDGYGNFITEEVFIKNDVSDGTDRLPSGLSSAYKMLCGDGDSRPIDAVDKALDYFALSTVGPTMKEQRADKEHKLQGYFPHMLLLDETSGAGEGQDDLILPSANLRQGVAVQELSDALSAAIVAKDWRKASRRLIDCLSPENKLQGSDRKEMTEFITKFVSKYKEPHVSISQVREIVRQKYKENGRKLVLRATPEFVAEFIEDVV